MPVRAIGAGVVSAAVLAAPACGGKVVVDHEDLALSGDGGGGAGAGTGAGPTSTTSAPTSTSSTWTTTTSGTSSSSSTTTTTTWTTTGGEGGEGGFGGSGGAPPIAALVETDLGEVPFVAETSFEVPPNVLGFTVVARTKGEDLIGIESLTAPDKVAVVANYTIGGTLASYGGYGISLASVPQSDAPEAMPVMSGTWKLSLGALEGGADTAHVSVWHRQTVDGQFHGGVIDVNAFVVEGVADEPYIKSALKDAFKGYAGLKLGKITFHELGEEWAVIDETNFWELFEQTADAEGRPALNVMFVSTLTGELEGAAGVTPGAPAWPLEHGTKMSGFVATVWFDPVLDTVILRHEAGHLAGLFHTSELEPNLGDALADTPFCKNVELEGEDCPDFDNLMFPTGGNFAMALSPKQIQVIRGSTFYRGIVEEGGAPAAPLPQGGAPPPDGASPPAPVPTAARFRGPLRSLLAGRPLAPAGWAAGLPRAMVAYMKGAWCGALAFGKHVDHYAILRSLGGDDPAQLLAIGADSSAPLHVRSRALTAAGKTSPPEQAVALLRAIAEDTGAPRPVREGALSGLVAASRAEALAASSRLAGDPDRLVAALAKHLQR